MLRIRIRNPEGKLDEFTLVTIVSEEILVNGKKTLKAMAYCFDKSRKPYIFQADQIEKYEK